MKLQEISEVCYGLIQEGRHPASLYKPDWFVSPYDEAVRVLQQKGATKEDVAKVMSSAYMTDAADAVHKFNGLGEYQNYDWPRALAEAYYNYERGRKFQKLSKDMLNNEPFDVLPVYAELGATIAKRNTGLVPFSEIDYNTYKPFKKSGYAPLDNTLGGIPSDGPIVIYGLTGVGKSTLATSIITSLLNQYPDEKAAVFTLEMNVRHWAWRTVNMFKKVKHVADRLFVSGEVRDIEEVISLLSVGNYQYAVLDDMDNLVQSSDASEYERVYRRVKEVCRFMGIPVFVLGQPNRAAKVEVGNGNRFLNPYDVAWSGAAENSAALLLAAQRVKSGVQMQSEEFVTADEPLDYLIAWKSRDGWPGDYDPRLQKGPGAIVMHHSPDWNGKPYRGAWKIWSPETGTKKIGKGK